MEGWSGVWNAGPNKEERLRRSVGYLMPKLYSRLDYRLDSRLDSRQNSRLDPGQDSRF